MPTPIQNLLSIWPPQPDAIHLLDSDPLAADVILNRYVPLSRHQFRMSHFQEVSHQTVRAYQSWFLKSPIGTDSFDALFPGAYRLREGQRVTNLSTSEVGELQGVGRNHVGTWGAAIKGFSPSRNHVLAFQPEDIVRFHEAKTRAEPAGVPYDRDTDYDKNAGHTVPTIVWAATRREPGSSGTPFSGERKVIAHDRGPRFYEPGTNPSYSLARVHNDMDVLIQMDMLENGESEAEALLEWFQRYQEDYVWWFRLLGLPQYHWWRTGRDDPLMRFGNQLSRRSAIYYLRVREVRTFAVRNLTDLRITIGLSPGDELVGPAPDPTGEIIPAAISDLGLTE
jgi:hypothetical protein